MHKCPCFFACILDCHSIYTVFTNINASSSNGRTADSDSVNRGSNPCEAASVKKSSFLTTFSFIFKHLNWFKDECILNACFIVSSNSLLYFSIT